MNNPPPIVNPIVYDFESVLLTQDVADAILSYDPFDLINMRYCCKKLNSIYESTLRRSVKKGNIRCGYTLSYRISSYYLCFPNEYILDSMVFLKVNKEYFAVEVKEEENVAVSDSLDTLGRTHTWYRFDLSKRIKDASSIHIILREGCKYESGYFVHSDDEVPWDFQMKTGEISLFTDKGTITSRDGFNIKIPVYNVILVSEFKRTLPISSVKRTHSSDIFYSLLSRRD